MEDYIQIEEQNKISFLEDLRKFKVEFNKIKGENKRLKEKIKEHGFQNMEVPMNETAVNDPTYLEAPRPDTQNRSRENQPHSKPKLLAHPPSRSVSQSQTKHRISEQQIQSRHQESKENRNFNKYEDLVMKMKGIMNGE